MELFKQWIYCACISLLIASVLSVFAPHGRLERFYKMLISLFVFASFILPLKDLNISSLSLNNYTVSNEMSIDETYENEVNAIIYNTLKDNGITGADINSSISVSGENNQISVNRVQISVPDEYDLKDAENIVYKELGIVAEVKHTGE